MRLHSLNLTGIGPFKATQEIDFDDLSSSGLFLIEGPTGSGKTTIIDAIVYALFGVVSAGSDDLTRMRIRSSYCDEADPTGVACEFSVDGRRHRITRVPGGCRDPEDPTRKSSSKGPRQVLVELGPDGEHLGAPLAVRREVDARVEELLGMTAEQFRQLVVLPQGQFSELLRKTPAERLASLAPLLEDDLIARVQEDLRMHGDRASEQRIAAAQRSDRAAQRLAGRLKTELATQDPDQAIDFTDAGVGDRARRDEVTRLLEAVGGQADAAMAERQAQADRTERLRAAAEASALVLDRLGAVVEARERVSAARSALDPTDHDLPDEAVHGQISDLRRLEGSLEAHAEWEAGSAGRDEARAELDRVHAAHLSKAEGLRAELAALPQQRARLEEQRSAATALAAQVRALEVSEATAQSLVTTARALAERRGELSEREREASAARAEERAAAARAEQSQLAWEALVRAHRSGSAASLAEGLVTGEPCPVCGSCDHPAPAQAAEGETTRAELDDAAAVASRARSAWQEALERTSEASRREAEAATAVATLEGAVARRTLAELEAELIDASAALTAAQQAEEALPSLHHAIASLSERQADAQAALLAEETAAATAAATRDAADEAERRRRDEIAAIVGDGTTATTVIAQTRDRIARLTDLADAVGVLGESLASVPPEQRTLSVEEAAEHARRDEAEHAEAAARLAALTDRHAALAAMLEDATPLADAFLTALDTERDVHEHTAAPLALAALVTAGNSRRLQLRAYALQRRFESVLAAASLQLERMSSGKFSFVPMDEASRGQAGLGIQLLDAWTGHLQDPRSLSGGETFYASLALALGLAEVVRNEVGGAQLETLFVDEGFGSLDQDTLYQVLEQLDRLRAGNRAVGVVSHVTEMKESIPDRLEVRRLPDSTSTIARAS